MKELTDKQQAFVEHYCTDAFWNGTQAAIMAKYSEKTAAQQASRLLTKVNIKEAIAKKKAEIARESGISVVFLTNKFLYLAQKAEKADNWGEARRNYREIGQHIGYYRPEVEPIEGTMAHKELPEPVRRVIAEALDQHYQERFCAQKAIKQIENTITGQKEG